MLRIMAASLNSIIETAVFGTVDRLVRHVHRGYRLLVLISILDINCHCQASNALIDARQVLNLEVHCQHVVSIRQAPYVDNATELLTHQGFKAVQYN